MLSLIRKYKSVLQFLTIFLGSYLVFVTLYNLYLTYGGSSRYFPDVITHIVALQSQSIIAMFGYTIEVVPSTTEPAMNLSINGTVLARIVEGCNAVSIMLLFMSFMLAFFGNLKRTLFFMLGGLVIIYVINILRIALLSITIFEYPEYTDFLHGTLFPAIIYGTVFLLWFWWINSYKKPVKK